VWLQKLAFPKSKAHLNRLVAKIDSGHMDARQKGATLSLKEGGSETGL